MRTRRASARSWLRSRSAAAGTARTSSCANPSSPRSGPALSPRRPPPSRARTGQARASRSDPPPSLYTEPRITHVGDIVTVIIAINDKATLGNTSGRSQTTKDGLADRLRLQQRISLVLVESAGQDPRRPLVELGDAGTGQHRPLRADPGVGRGGRHPRAAERQSRHFRVAGGARQLRASPADGRRHRAIRTTSRSTTRSPTTTSPRRAFPMADAAARATCSSRPGDSRSMTPSSHSSGSADV